MKKRTKITLAEQFRKEALEHPTPSELIAKELLIKAGVNFNREHIFYHDGGKSFRVDFFLPRHNVVIEIDGGYHDTVSQKRQDKKREDILINQNGVKKILRFTNDEMLNPKQFLEKVSEYATSIPIPISSKKIDWEVVTKQIKDEGRTSLYFAKMKGILTLSKIKFKHKHEFIKDDKPIIADFYIPEYGLVIEIDDNKDKNITTSSKIRTEMLKRINGVKVVKRFNSKTMIDTIAVERTIKEIIRNIKNGDTYSYKLN